jgi:hypothetical protein
MIHLASLSRLTMVRALSRLMLIAACLHLMRQLSGGAPSNLRNMGLRYVGLLIAASMCQVAIVVPSVANTVIASCGASSGWRYDTGVSNLEEGGWKEDAITDGSTIFLSTGSGFDVVLKDAYGTKTALEENAKIDVIEVGSDAYTFLVRYPRGTVVVYGLSAPAAGKRKLVWSILRNGSGMTELQGSVFASVCE